MKQHVFAALTVLSSVSYGQGLVSVNHGGEKTSMINSDLTRISFGGEKNDGHAVAKIIAFANKHRKELVNSDSEIGKFYFKPEEKVFAQGETASIRLYQALYFKDKNNKQVYIPFEGAELSAYITGLKDSNHGELKSINSSLIDSSSYEKYINKFSTYGPHTFKTVSATNRALLVNSLKFIELRDLNAELYPQETFKDRQSFIKRAIEDKLFVVNFMNINKENSKLIFTKDPRSGVFRPVYRVHSPFGSDRILDLEIEHHNKNLISSDKSFVHNVHVNIYTGTILNLKKNLRRDGDSKVWKDKKIKRGLFKQEDYDHALINLSKVVEYFKDTFSWNGFDNKGSDLNATVRYKGSKLFGTRQLKQNAAWVGGEYNQFLFGAGGKTLGNFLEAFDVIGHEYFHSVINFTSALANGGESGALNEHLSDILGVGFESEIRGKEFDFQIGEEVVLDSNIALRDFLSPEKSFSEQPSHMNQVREKFGEYCYPNSENDECGVHYSNGVLNRAIGLSIKDLGWSRMKSLIFEVATKRLRSSSDFQDYRLQILNTCKESKEFTTTDCNKIADHFETVGISSKTADSSNALSDSVNYDEHLCSIINQTCAILGDELGSLDETCKRCANL